MICYPIKYKNKLYGVLFAGDPLRPELTEGQADMGMLVAHQLAASLYHLESEALYERQKKRHEAYQEIVRALVATPDKEDYLQLFIECFQQQIDCSFMCLLLHLPDGEGTEVYSSSTAPDELYTLYAEDAKRIYFADGIPGFNLLNKPIRREWRGRQLVEHPMVFEQRLLGLFTIQFRDERQRQEYELFLQMTNVLLVTKLLVKLPLEPPSRADLIQLLQDVSLTRDPGEYNRAVTVKNLAQGLLEQMNRSAEEIEWISQAALLAPYDVELLAGYLGEIEPVCILRHMEGILSGSNGKKDPGESSCLYLAKVLIMLKWYTDKGRRDWKETLPALIPGPLVRSFEQFIHPPPDAALQEEASGSLPVKRISWKACCWASIIRRSRRSCLSVHIRSRTTLPKSTRSLVYIAGRRPFPRCIRPRTEQIPTKSNDCAETRRTLLFCARRKEGL